MSNNKFHFEFKKRIFKFRIFFPSRSKKKLQLRIISKIYPLKFFFLNYNKCKLLTFKYRRASKHARAHIYIYIYTHTQVFEHAQTLFLFFWVKVKNLHLL